MAHQEERKIAVAFLDVLSEHVLVLEVGDPAVLIGEVAQRDLTVVAFAMAAVIGDDDNAVKLCQKSTEFLIAFLVFSHAVDDLNDRHRIVGNIQVSGDLEAVSLTAEFYLFLFHIKTSDFTYHNIITNKCFFIYNVIN